MTPEKNMPNGDESLPQGGQERGGMPPLSSDGPQSQGEMCVRAESLGRFVGEGAAPSVKLALGDASHRLLYVLTTAMRELSMTIKRHLFWTLDCTTG